MAAQPALVQHGAPSETSPSQAQTIFQILVLGLLLALLINYKGAGGVNKIRQTLTAGRLSVPTLQIGTGAGTTTAFWDAVAYVKIVWPALVFGVLISAAVRTSLSRTPLHKIFGHGSVRDEVAGALVGAPLMLCSCCVAPIFPAVYQRTRRVAPALALTLASPSLNTVALTLSFILFPLRIAGARVAMALILVFLGSAFVAKITRASALAAALETDEQQSNTWPELLTSYAHSLAHVSVRTVPLILLGIWASMWSMRRLPPQIGAATGAHVLAVAIIALFAVMLTLPSLFEIPLALLMLSAGGPAGGAAALLFAGPAINLPSLLVIGRYSSWKVAAGLAVLVWGIALTGGLLLR
jgi:uncharacterized membrane protein YraQ (UPF0718 family)